MVVDDETDQNVLFTRKILFVEPQGSHTIIVVEVDGKQMKLVTSDVMAYTVGQEIKIAMNDKYMLFDAETEKRIR